MAGEERVELVAPAAAGGAGGALAIALLDELVDRAHRDAQLGAMLSEASLAA
jgi:hypothetical protein